MECNNCQELFSDYLDRLMDEPQLRLLEKHLEECPACAEEWECFTAAVNWVRRMQFTAPPEIMQGIRQKIAGDKPHEKLLSRLFNFLRFHDFSLPLPAAAATLAVALLAMLSIKYFTAGNLPHFHTPQVAEQENIGRSIQADRPDASLFHAQPPSMFQHPELSDAAYSDVDGVLPLQQFGPQFVTSTAGPETPVLFATDNGFAPSSHAAELSARQFYSMLTGHHLQPDVRIQVNNLPLASRLQLSRQLLNNPAWSAQHFGGDTILLQMDPYKLKKLHGLLAGHHILIIPPDATDTAFGSPKKVLTVAVRMR